MLERVQGGADGEAFDGGHGLAADRGERGEAALDVAPGTAGGVLDGDGAGATLADAAAELGAGETEIFLETSRRGRLASALGRVTGLPLTVSGMPAALMSASGPPGRARA